MRVNYLILKDLRAYSALRGICKNKKTKSLFVRSLLAERAGRERASIAEWGRQRIPGKEKSGLATAWIREIPAKHITKIYLSLSRIETLEKKSRKHFGNGLLRRVLIRRD
jgi:hypothetical protein